MAPRPALAKNEVEVARIVWELRDATVRQVLERLEEHRTVDFSSVQTWLRRLEEKGYLKVRLEGRTRVYSARVKPRTVIRETVDDLVKRLFSGETMPLMQHLIEDRGDISSDEIAQLRQLLDQLESDGESQSQSRKGKKS